MSYRTLSIEMWRERKGFIKSTEKVEILLEKEKRKSRFHRKVQKK